MTPAIRRQLAVARAAAAPAGLPKPPHPVAAATSQSAGTGQQSSPAGYGVVTVPEFPGQRFVAVGASPALVQQLAGVCRAAGLREMQTNQFIARSVSHGDPKEK